MTKARAPSTFEDAITRIAARIGWDGAAEAVGKVEKVVRNWSDPDMNRLPSIDEALAMDAAFIASGGGEGPLMAVYQLKLERSGTPPSDIVALARATGVVARESGEAVAALVAAAQPGASAADVAKAEREVIEGIESMTSALRKLGAPALRSVA